MSPYILLQRMFDVQNIFHINKIEILIYIQNFVSEMNAYINKMHFFYEKHNFRLNDLIIYVRNFGKRLRIYYNITAHKICFETLVGSN